MAKITLTNNTKWARECLESGSLAVLPNSTSSDWINVDGGSFSLTSTEVSVGTPSNRESWNFRIRYAIDADKYNILMYKIWESHGSYRWGDFSAGGRILDSNYSTLVGIGGIGQVDLSQYSGTIYLELWTACSGADDGHGRVYASNLILM